VTSAQEPSRERVTLSGVSETALLTLNARAREARRQDPIIADPMAVALVDAIEFDFAKFGPTRQDIALRARAIDIAAQSYLSQHPSATVVALAEGLQTSFWRLDAALPDGQFRWLTVDLPPIVDVRTRRRRPRPRARAWGIGRCGP
jgi:O-methyltransferase involved in polyketide biosynthesis